LWGTAAKIDPFQNGVDRKLLALEIEPFRERREDLIDGHSGIFLGGQDNDLHLRMMNKQTEEFLARITGCPNNPILFS
jgi:hypothetical protein